MRQEIREARQAAIREWNAHVWELFSAAASGLQRRGVAASDVVMRLGPITGEASYAQSLYRLGTMVSPGQYGQPRATREVDAWAWARGHARSMPWGWTDAMDRARVTSLTAYVRWAGRLRDDDPRHVCRIPSTHPIWRAVEIDPKGASCIR